MPGYSVTYDMFLAAKQLSTVILDMNSATVLFNQTMQFCNM
jgi:hypothetical protein